MKTALTAFLFLILMAAGATLAAIATKPTDQDCLAHVIEHYTGSSIAARFLSPKASEVFEVRDYALYKVVVNRITGREVAVAYFGTVNDLQ